MSYSLTLGPSHPAWRGLQRYALTVEGEQITDVEFSDEQPSQGLFERVNRLDLAEARSRVGRICATSHVAHGLAFCLAIEELCGIEIGARATTLRCAAAEIERIAAHLEAAGRVVWALGMEPGATALSDLARMARQVLETLASRGAVAEFITPGGVSRDLERAGQEQIMLVLPKLNRALYQQIESMIDNQLLLRRTVEVGAIPRVAAEQFGICGPLGRASGIARDLRVDQQYGVYNTLSLRTISQDGGDLYARLIVLLLEAYESVKLADQLLREVPGGAWRSSLPREFAGGPTRAQVEGPNGPIRYTVAAAMGRLTQLEIETPRPLDRLLARTLLAGALIDNAVAIIASADHCPYCVER